MLEFGNAGITLVCWGLWVTRQRLIPVVLENQPFERTSLDENRLRSDHSMLLMRLMERRLDCLINI